MNTLAEVVTALRGGGVVGIPTDTVYGLAVLPDVRGSTSALFALKQRPDSLSLPVLVPDLAAAVDLVGALSPDALAMATSCWPGPLTIVVVRPPRSRAASFDLGADQATIGLRCPDHAVALEVLRATGPLAVTSANHHGEPPLTEAAAVGAVFGAGVAAVLDGGTCDGSPSSVVSCANGRVEVLREGPISAQHLRDLLGRGLITSDHGRRAARTGPAGSSSQLGQR